MGVSLHSLLATIAQKNQIVAEHFPRRCNEALKISKFRGSSTCPTSVRLVACYTWLHLHPLDNGMLHNLGVSQPRVNQPLDSLRRIATKNNKNNGGINKRNVASGTRSADRC